MNRSSPKISFDVQQRVIPKTAKADRDAAVEPGARADVDGDVDKVTKNLPLPPVFSSTDTKPAAKVAPQPKIDAQAADDAPKAFRPPTPKPPLFAATGLMGPQQAGFFRRHAKPLGLAGSVALVFVLGLMTVSSLVDDEAPQSFSAAAALPVQDTPTRSVVADLTDVSAATDTIVATDEIVEGDTAGQAVLAGLRPQARQARPQAEAPRQVEGETLLSANKLRQLREGVLGGVYSVVVVENDGARRVELVTHNIEMDAGYEEELLVEAGQNGLLELSGALRTPEGKLDSKTMIFDVVQRSLLADETSESSKAALDMSRKVFAASVARTQFVNGQRIYTVQPGDSLAYIALQFFGMPTEYTRILEENRSTLQSPDKIQIGQRLIIPS